MFQVVKAPDSKLRVQTKPVKKINPALIQTLKDMVKLTKTFKDPEGVGLASTQVGLGERFFVSLWSDKDSKKDKQNEKKSTLSQHFKSIINPKILKTSPKLKKYFEGCLSIPNLWGEVERGIWVQVQYQDESGKVIKEKLTGLKAHIFQHEVDHLDGILFTQRVLEQKGKLFKFSGKDKTGADMFEEVAI